MTDDLGQDSRILGISFDAELPEPTDQFDLMRLQLACEQEIEEAQLFEDLEEVGF